jgi:hypothetical protein
MTPSDDELLHEALRDDAGAAVPPPGGFAQVQERATTHTGRRRRMAMFVAVAAVALVAIIAGSVFAATRSDNEGGRIATVPDETSSVPETTPSTVADTTLPEPTTVAPSTTAARVTPPTGTLPPNTSFAAVTDWRPELDVDSIPYATTPAADPWQKVDMIAAGITAEPVEGRREVQGIVNSVEGDRAVIEIRVIGLADDSVGGVDYRMTLLQGPDGQWNVTGGETRDYCIRGSDGTLCV